MIERTMSTLIIDNFFLIYSYEKNNQMGSLSLLVYTGFSSVHWLLDIFHIQIFSTSKKSFSLKRIYNLRYHKSTHRWSIIICYWILFSLNGTTTAGLTAYDLLLWKPKPETHRCLYPSACFWIFCLA